jgi:hypothetical protein
MNHLTFIVNVSVVYGATFGFNSSSPGPEILRAVALPLNAAIAGVAIIALVSVEQNRLRANGYRDSIVDKLQWFEGRERAGAKVPADQPSDDLSAYDRKERRNEKDNFERERWDLMRDVDANLSEVRFDFRALLNTQDLPLVRGQRGAGIYFVVNLVPVIFWLALIVFRLSW